MFSAITALFSWFTNTVCLSCRQQSDSSLSYICQLCLSKIPSMRTIKKCSKCHHISDLIPCDNCIESTIYWDSLESFFPYNDPIIKQLYHLYKFQNSKFAEKDISLLLSDRIPIDQDYKILTVPCSRETAFRLGCNPVHKILKNLEFPCLDILKRKRFSKKIKELPRSDRQQQSNFLYIKANDIPKIENQKIILVDDILTTGATLNHASQILKTHGAEIVKAIVFFRA